VPLDQSLDPLFESAGQQYNVDPNLLRALHLAETGGTGRWDLTSPAGAQGGMQFMPETAAQYGVKDPTDPKQAIPGAAHLLSDLLNTYEGQVGPGPQAVTMALKGYNAGAPSRWNNPETAGYPGAVASYYAQLTKPQGYGKPQPSDAEILALVGQKGPMTGNGYPIENLGSTKDFPTLPPNTTNYTPTGPGDPFPGTHIDPTTGLHLASAQRTPMPQPDQDTAIPPWLPRNSRGEPYLPLSPGDMAAAGTQGAGPTISAADAAQANATDPNAGQHLPVMPSNYIFGTGKVAPPGAGTVGTADSGIAALAAAGRPSGNNPAAPGAQTAQVQPRGMSDEDLLNGFVNGTLPFMQQPKAAPPPTPANAPAAAPAVPTPAPQASSAPALDVQGLVDTYNRYRSFPAGVPIAQGALGLITKMQPENMVLNQDGSLSLRPGAAQGTNTLEANKAAGGQLQAIDSTGAVQNMPNANQAAQDREAAKAAGAGTDVASANAKAQFEAEMQRITAGMAPQNFRGVGSGVVYPPGSPGAAAFGAGATGGTGAPGGSSPPEEGGPSIKRSSNGSVTIENTNAAPETIGHNFETLTEMGKQADASRAEIFQAKLLKDRLQAIGTSGPLTQQLGKLSALAQQAGVPKDVISGASIPQGATVEEANAIALGLLGDTVHKLFPTRVTNTDLTTYKPSNPNANILNEASNYLIDNLIVPRAQRDVARYGAATALPQNDPQAFRQKLFEWDEANPYEKFLPQTQVAAPGASQNPVAATAAPGGNATPQYQENQTATNPQTGERRVFKGGQWTPITPTK
jgi:hypothetical protein